jgi:MFS family permease
VALALFAVVEARSRFPLVDLSLFANPAFSVANALSLLANAAMFAIWLLAPTLLVTIRGHGTILGGLVLAASPAASTLLAPLAGRWTTALGAGRLSTIGLVVEAVGLAAVSRVGAATSTLAVIGAFALVGAGLGLFQVPNLSYVMGSIPRAQQGVAAGITQMTRTAGVVGGVAAANALFVARSRAHARPPLTTGSEAVFVAAFRDVLLGAALLCLAAAVLSLVRPRSEAPEAGAAAAGAVGPGLPPAGAVDRAT